MINTTTFYTNLAYLKYNSASALNSKGQTIGAVHSGGLVSFSSTDLYSVTGLPGGAWDAVAYPFNFADLVPPVPASAYLGMAICQDDSSPLFGSEFDAGGGVNLLNGEPDLAYAYCHTILDWAYAPRLVAPAAYRDVDPAWATCGLDLVGIYDVSDPFDDDENCACGRFD